VQRYEEDVVELSDNPPRQVNSHHGRQKKKLLQCFESVSMGRVGKTSSALLSKGASNPHYLQVKEQLKAKYLALKFPIQPSSNQQLQYDSAWIERGDVDEVIQNLDILVRSQKVW